MSADQDEGGPAMTQHTPGPWHLNTQLGIKNPLYRGTVCILGETPDGEWLSVVVSDDARAWHTSDGDRMRANAALIASAPDMLAALQRLLAPMASWGGCSYCAPGFGLQWHDPDCPVTEARAAIDKATGGQP